MSNKNIDIELNQDYFTFGKKNYRKYQTEQCYIYNNKAIHIQKHVLKKPLISAIRYAVIVENKMNEFNNTWEKWLRL